MRPTSSRFLLAMMVTCVLHASTMTFSSCTAGTTTDSPCPSDVNLITGLSGPNYFVAAFAATGPGTGLPGTSVIAEAAAVYTGGAPPPLPALSAGAQASENDTYYTTGPTRLGFIQFDMDSGASSSHGGLGDVVLTDGVHSYGPGSGTHVGGCAESCHSIGTLPFDLGTEFQVLESASAGASLTPSSGVPDSVQGGFATVTFTLLEADGTTPVPFSVVPEPSSWALSVLGFGLGCVLWWSRRRWTL